MHHMNLRAIRQSLAARGIRIDRDGSNPDGSQRYAVWPIGKPRITARKAADLDTGYVIGLRLAA